MSENQNKKELAKTYDPKAIEGRLYDKCTVCRQYGTDYTTCIGWI